MGPMLSLLTADPQALMAALPADVVLERATGDVMIVTGTPDALQRAARLPGVLAAHSHDFEFDQVLRGEPTRGVGRRKIVVWADDLDGYVALLAAVRDLGVTPLRLMFQVLMLTAYLTPEDEAALASRGFAMEVPQTVRIP